MAADGVIYGYAIAGAVMAIFYTEPSDTVDLDILVAFPKTDSLLTPRSYRFLPCRVGIYRFWERGYRDRGNSSSVFADDKRSVS
jgi:hypothetical protein